MPRLLLELLEMLDPLTYPGMTTSTSTETSDQAVAASQALGGPGTSNTSAAPSRVKDLPAMAGVCMVHVTRGVHVMDLMAVVDGC